MKKGRPNQLVGDDRGVRGGQRLATAEKQGLFRLSVQIAPLIDKREVVAVLHIGPRFSADLRRGDTAPLQLLIDGRNSKTALLVRGYLGRIVRDFNVETERRVGLPPPMATVQTRPWYNANLESRWFIVPGIVGLLTLVVTTIVTALSVAREREAGTFDQLLVTPLRPLEVLVGKAFPGVLIGTLEGSFILLMAVYWFEVPLRGSMAALYLGLFLFLLSAVGIGLMISSLAVTQQQGMLGAFLFLVPAVILSGFATPVAYMPEAVQLLTTVNPLRYFLVILRGVFLEGAGFAVLSDCYWPMAIIAVATLAMAAWLFRHRLS